MPLYEVTGDGLQERSVEQFAALGMYERPDLQRLLRDRISALGEDLHMISEEFGNWETLAAASTSWPWTRPAGSWSSS